jgi:hypothetical protein
MTRSRFLFAVVVFLAAFLLFLVEPMVAKQLVPVLGGSAAVWITCLVFFQTALLCAYAYVHWFARHPRWTVHLVLLASAVALAAFWAFGSIDFSSGPEHPVATIFAALGLWIGLPFLALGATSPLLQFWWSRVERGPVPYGLFALSNLASLLALAAYPTLIEPNFTLHVQRWAWFVAFLLFVALATTLTLRSRAAVEATPQDSAADEQAVPSSPVMHKWLWLLLPMCASMQLSAVTSYLSANIAPIPLLWVLPLGVYLLTIIIAFEFPRLVPRSIVARLLAVMLASLGYMLSQTDVSLPMRIGIAFFLAELLVAGVFCHSEAYALRPQRASESTLFYLLFAAGGAIGSFLVGLAFPFLFSFNYDLVITCFVAAALALVCWWQGRWAVRLLWIVASVMMLFLLWKLHAEFHRETVVAVRNFYGPLRVKQNIGPLGATMRTLTNGNIQHGTQIFGTDAQRKTPTTYYAPDSGAGLALRFCCADRPRRIGVIGLGAGTLAAYGRPADHFSFYEINPAVAPIARNVFTYIRESGAQIDIVDGDARTSLTREVSQRFDVLVIDAFSGDAIPLHLLTTQALELYRRHLAPGGIVAFHISNLHVDLEPAVALLAHNAGMHAVQVISAGNENRGEFNATWMLVSDNADFFAQPGVAAGSKPVLYRPGLRLWTDDYSSLLPILRW